MKILRYLVSLLVFIPSLVSAQVLVKDHVSHPKQFNEGYYDVEPDFVYKNEFRVEFQHCLNEFAARYQFKEMELKLPEGYNVEQIMFFGHHDNGQYAVTIKEFDDGSADYVLHMFNNMDRCYSSVNLSDQFQRFSRITHFVYYRGLFYFNMEAIDGQVGDVEHTCFYYVYCYNPETERIIWESESETSRGEFLITDDYIFAGFGGDNCNDFITLLSRDNGRNLCMAPMPTQPTAVGLAGDSIYFTDYQGEMYRFLVQPRGVKVTGKGVRLRRGPGTNYDIFADPFTGKTVYPLENDVLAYAGETDEWYQVRFMGENLYISKQFSMLYEGEANAPFQLAYQQWLDASVKRCSQYVSHPYAELSIPFDGEESSFVVLTNERQAAVFLQDPSGKMTLITEGDPNELHVYPEIQTVRYYFGNAIGLEEERIYVVEHGRLTDIWTRSIKPLGNIREQDEISVETQCTHIVNGKTTKCKESEFEAISEAVRDVEEYSIIDAFDL